MATQNAKKAGSAVEKGVSKLDHIAKNLDQPKTAAMFIAKGVALGVISYGTFKAIDKGVQMYQDRRDRRQDNNAGGNTRNIRSA